MNVLAEKMMYYLFDWIAEQQLQLLSSRFKHPMTEAALRFSFFCFFNPLHE
jgi:hypothetical protein